MNATTMADLVRQALHDEGFQRAVFSGAAKGADSPWRRVVVRRVALRGVVHTQVSRHTDANVETRNHDTVDAVVEELAAVPFRTAHVELHTATVEARVTKRGRLLVSRQATTTVGSLAHDRVRERPVPEDAAFLEVLGISRDGAVIPTGQRKYRQINEFVRVLAATLVDQPDGPLRVLDLGCGHAYLTFATVDHLARRGIEARVTGVDRDPATIARNTERAQRLGWPDRLTFTTAPIDGYVPDGDPDVVMALHACDTATDDVLALAVAHDARFVLVSPCCHHDLQRQLRSGPMPAAFRDLARDGILTERLGDVVTDSLRASLMRTVGYAVDVFSFVPVEHTARNTLLRAVRTTGRTDPAAEASALALTTLFDVRPRLADLLRNRLPQPRAGGADEQPADARLAGC